MTSLIAWIGVDSRGPASAYLAADSRISWNQGATRWDAGRKVFAARRSADMFGYCGNVLFPSLVLGQVCQLLDLTMGVGRGPTPWERHETLLTVAEESLSAYPSDQRSGFSLLHCTRESERMKSSFHLWRTDWDPHRGWSDEQITLPTESVLVLNVGSGSSTVSDFDYKWRQTSVGRTSRAVFSAFCDALASGSDPQSGGAPQLVGLYRTGSAEALGVIHKGQRYLIGAPLNAEQARVLTVEWRNELFERCDGASMAKFPDAQPHARPREVTR